MEMISMASFTQRLAVEHLHIIDVRERDEFANGHIPGAQNYPLSELLQLFRKLSTKQSYYLICSMGGRSARAAYFLDKHGFQVISVNGGMNDWQGELVFGNEREKE